MSLFHRHRLVEPQADARHAVFLSAADAKRFLADRIVGQALSETSPLSQDQQWMLRFSESDPEFVLDPARVHQFDAEIDDAAYEAKMAGLLQRAYDRDVQTDDTAGVTYREAALTLAQEDHYLSVIVDRALPFLTVVPAGPGDGRAWLLDRVRLVLTAVTLLGAVGAAGLALSAYYGRTPTSDEILVYAWGAMMSGAVVYTLLRIVFGASATDALVDRIVRVFAGAPER